VRARALHSLKIRSWVRQVRISPRPLTWWAFDAASRRSLSRIGGGFPLSSVQRARLAHASLIAARDRPQSGASSKGISDPYVAFVLDDGRVASALNAASSMSRNDQRPSQATHRGYVALLEKQVSHLDSGDTRTYKPLGKTFAFFGCHGPAINSCLRWRRRRPPFLSSGMV